MVTCGEFLVLSILLRPGMTHSLPRQGVCASFYSRLRTACERQSGKRNSVLQVSAICLLGAPSQKQSKRREQAAFAPQQILNDCPHLYKLTARLFEG